MVNNIGTDSSAINLVLPSSHKYSGTLFDKMGAEDGMRLFVDKIFEKIVADPDLCKYYVKPEINLSLVKDKYRYYFTHMIGGAEHWIGCPIDKAHRGTQISDTLFDQFNSHCI